MDSAWKEQMLADLLFCERQHVNINAYVDKLINLMGLDSLSVDEMVFEVNALVSAIDEHFISEERLMKQACYHSTDDHRDHYDSFRLELAFQVNRSQKHGFGIASETLGYIKGWSHNHDILHDRPFHDFMMRRVRLSE